MNPSLIKRALAVVVLALGAVAVARHRRPRARQALAPGSSSPRALGGGTPPGPASAVTGITVGEAIQRAADPSVAPTPAVPTPAVPTPAAPGPGLSSLRSLSRRRRGTLAAAALAFLLAAGGALGWYLNARQAGRDVVGSSTVEFVTTDLPPALTVAVTTQPAAGTTAPRAKPPLPPVIWPTYGFDNRRLRNVPTGPLPPFRTIWSFRGRALLEFPPTLAYGRLTIATNQGLLHSIDARTGKAVWTYPSGRCVAASPAVAGRVVYASFMNRPPCNAKGADLDGEVIAFDALTGKIRWRAAVGVTESSPLVAGGLVVVGDWKGDVTALAARTGAVVWTFHTGGKVKGAAALADGRLVIGSYDGSVYALDPRSGALLWKASAQERIGSRGTFYATPALAFGRVYIGATDGKVYSFGAESGKLRWSQSTGGYVYASAAIWRKSVLVGSYSGAFLSLDAATGAEQWRFRADGPISGSATVIGDVVYVSTLARRTYALDAATGKLLWTFPDGKYAAVITDGEHLYLVGYTRVYAMVPTR